MDRGGDGSIKNKINQKNNWGVNEEFAVMIVGTKQNFCGQTERCTKD